MSRTRRALLIKVVGAAVLLMGILHIARSRYSTSLPAKEIFDLLSGASLAGQLFNVRKYPELQKRIGRDERPDLFHRDIRDGISDFWERFQKPFIVSEETRRRDEEEVRVAIDDLLGFKGWAAATCSTLIRPFQAGSSHTDASWVDLQEHGHKYYFAVVLHEGDHFLIDQLAVIIQVSKQLGIGNVFVSMVDYASKDSTAFLTDMCEMVLTMLGIPFRILHMPPQTADTTLSYYPDEESFTRNLALQPLRQLLSRKVAFERVIWLKGFTCPDDVLESLRVSFVNDAAMVCSMDWKEHQGKYLFNDRWRTRDINGNLFRASVSNARLPPPYDPNSAQRYQQHLPFQVFCCESGTHIVNPHESYYRGLEYRSGVDRAFNTSSTPDAVKTPRSSEGPCLDSSQLYFCRDIWMLSYRDAVLAENERRSEPSEPVQDADTPVSQTDKRVDPEQWNALLAAAENSEAVGRKSAYYDERYLNRRAPPNSGEFFSDSATLADQLMIQGKKIFTIDDDPFFSGLIDLYDVGDSDQEKQNGIAGAVVADHHGDHPEAHPEKDDIVFDNDKAYLDKEGSDADDFSANEDPGQAVPIGTGDGVDFEAAPMDNVDPAKQQQDQPAGNARKQGLEIMAKAEKEHAADAAHADALEKEEAAVVAKAGKKLAQKHADEFRDPAADAQNDDNDDPAALDKRSPHNKRSPIPEPPAESPAQIERRKRSLESRPVANGDIPNAVARIIVNPRCVTTYAGVSHAKLAMDLFGLAEDVGAADFPRVRNRYLIEKWRPAPESFVCQEMRSTGGRLAPKQQRRASFQQSRLLLDGWAPWGSPPVHV